MQAIHVLGAAILHGRQPPRLVSPSAMLGRPLLLGDVANRTTSYSERDRFSGLPMTCRCCLTAASVAVHAGLGGLICKDDSFDN